MHLTTGLSSLGLHLARRQRVRVSESREMSQSDLAAQGVTDDGGDAARVVLLRHVLQRGVRRRGGGEDVSARDAGVRVGF